MKKTVICDTPPDLLAQRQRTGADQWDEMWNGVLHMPPAPTMDHQDFEYLLENWLRRYWANPNGGRVYHNINVASIGGWPHDYRIPDVALVSPDRIHMSRRVYFEGPPLVVVEIHSPGDEAYEKFDFYAALGVPEVWVIHRDTRVPEVHVLENGEFVAQPATEGWMVSPATNVWLRPRRVRRLTLQLGDDQTTRVALPE